MKTLKQQLQESGLDANDQMWFINLVKGWLEQKRQEYKGEISKATIDELLEELREA